MLAAERETRGQTRFFLDFTNFSEAWTESLEPLASVLGNTWHSSLSLHQDENRTFLGSSPPVALPSMVEDPAWSEGLNEAWDWFRERCQRGGEGTGDGLDHLSGSGWMETALRLQPDAERVSDLAIEMRNARRLAVWYESEWHKTSVRAAKYKEQLDGVRRKASSKSK